MKENIIQAIPNKELLKELKIRVIENKISETEVFNALKTPTKPEIITEYKKVNYSKLTKTDWKKACEALKKDQNYQAEVKLWDSIDDE